MRTVDIASGSGGEITYDGILLGSVEADNVGPVAKGVVEIGVGDAKNSAMGGLVLLGVRPEDGVVYCEEWSAQRRDDLMRSMSDHQKHIMNKRCLIRV